MVNNVKIKVDRFFLFIVTSFIVVIMSSCVSSTGNLKFTRDLQKNELSNSSYDIGSKEENIDYDVDNGLEKLVDKKIEISTPVVSTNYSKDGKLALSWTKAVTLVEALDLVVTRVLNTQDIDSQDLASQDIDSKDIDNDVPLNYSLRTYKDLDDCNSNVENFIELYSGPSLDVEVNLPDRFQSYYFKVCADDENHTCSSCTNSKVFFGSASVQIPCDKNHTLNIPSVNNLAIGSDVHWDSVPLRSALQKSEGYKGGDAYQMGFTLAISDKNPDYMALGIDTAQVYISEDGGLNWENRHIGILSNGVQSLYFDPYNPNIIWAAGLKSNFEATQDKFYSTQTDGIYKSTDLGHTWAKVRSTGLRRFNFQNEYFQCLENISLEQDQVLENGCQNLLAVSHTEGLLKTTDGGLSWNLVFKPTGENPFFINVVKRASDGDIWLATNDGVYLSEDDGVSWNMINSIPAPDLSNGKLAYVSALVVDPTNSSIVYIARSNNGIWKTTDKGLTWTKQNMGSIWKDAYKWSRLAISKTNPQFLYADATEIGGKFPYRTLNGGTTWTPPTKVDGGLLSDGDSCHYYSQGIVIHPTNPEVGFTFRPLMKTIDGGVTWKYFGQNIVGSRLGSSTSTIAYDPLNRDRMMFFFTDLGSTLTEDGGDTWELKSHPSISIDGQGGLRTTPAGAFKSDDSNIIVAAVGGWYKQKLVRSTDRGTSWSVVFGDEYSDYRYIGWHQQDSNVVYVGTTGTVGRRSDDAGLTWKTLSRSIRAMNPNNSDIVYSITYNGSVANNTTIEISMDRGESWSPIGQNLLSSIENIAVDPVDIYRVYATGAWRGVFVFDGVSWVIKNGVHGLSNDSFGGLSIGSVAIDSSCPNVVYAGARRQWVGLSNGIFRSVDYGNSWHNINGNVGDNFAVWSINVNPFDSTLWLGTDYGSWRLSVDRIE